MRTRMIVLLFAVLAAGGCASKDISPLVEQIGSLTEERSLLRQRVGELERDNEQLTAQVKTLALLDEQVKLEVLTRLEMVEVGKRSGIFDKDKDGKCETLIVYIRSHDDYGDPYKASGSIELELWDLDGDVENARLGRWVLEPAEVKKLWSTTIITNYFRVTYDVGDLLTDEQDELTVKMKFTDYVTGRVFKDQRVVLLVK